MKGDLLDLLWNSTKDRVLLGLFRGHILKKLDFFQKNHNLGVLCGGRGGSKNIRTMSDQGEGRVLKLAYFVGHPLCMAPILILSFLLDGHLYVSTERWEGIASTPPPPQSTEEKRRVDKKIIIGWWYRYFYCFIISKISVLRQRNNLTNWLTTWSTK